jgi:hypothetical protein
LADNARWSAMALAGGLLGLAPLRASARSAALAFS